VGLYPDERTLDLAWNCERAIETESASAAINQFRRELIPIVNRIAFVSQCCAFVEFEPFLIAREVSPHSTFFLHYSEEVPPVSLHFDKEEQESLAALENFEEKGDLFLLLREAANTSSFYTRFAMLVPALESIAGTKSNSGRIETDKEFIRNEVLKNDELYKELFAYGKGARNKLFHGDKVLLDRDRQYIPEIHQAIVRFFNERFGTKINSAVRNPMRHLMGNFEVLDLFLKPRNGRVPCLKELVWNIAESRKQGTTSVGMYDLADAPDSF